jgi:hypothetical protein
MEIIDFGRRKRSKWGRQGRAGIQKEPEGMNAPPAGFGFRASTY